MTQRLVSRRGSLFFAGALAPARQTRLLARVLTAAVAIIISFAASLGPVIAQPAPPAPPAGILTDGDAAVTGFSGVQPPTLVAPGVDPADKTSIDLAGPSARVIDLDALGAPPQAQLIQATKPFTATAAQVGQVFAVALDNASPPNIYVAATSAYGLPIVVPDKDGDGLPDRVKQGAPNASFMPGLFGPAALSGGPGSIWRIDGATGTVRLFANVAFDGVPNSGPALGGLAFDPASKSLFVADRDTGMIHRFDLDGKELGRYDHGVQGRPAAGLPPVPFNPANRLDITKPQFQTANPATWAYAPPPRRIFGLAVHADRLYYAVAEGLQIWSVGITANAFGTDARREITVPSGQSPTEISKIIFDDLGRMLLAERVAPSGAFDFVALTEAGGGRVLRFEPSGGATGQSWQPAAGDPEAGLDASRSGNGGLAIGYGYDAAGQRNPASCGGTLWWTGEQLAPGGAEAVNGLQGRPEGAAAGWLIDFDDRLDDPQTRGQAGDVAVFRGCARAVAVGPPAEPAVPPGVPQPSEPGLPTQPMPAPEGGFGPGPGDLLVELWPDWPPPPPPICPPGTHLSTNALQCCPPGQIPGFTGACQSPCPNGSMNPGEMAACRRGFQPGNRPDFVHGPAYVGACWNGAPVLKVCGPNTLACNKCPKSPLERCPSGTTEVAGVPPPGPAGMSWEWSDRHCVAVGPPCAVPGQQRGLDGLCHLICPGAPGQTAYPVNRCCLNGTAPNALGQCPFGMLVSPLWYLHYLATGTGPCVPPNCSFYEFTVTGQERFGRGSLTQRITLPPGSAFPEARVTRGSKYCPASAWSCSKAGDVFTCSAEDCGLEPGDQVVVRLEGKVAPELTEPPPAPIEKTACGVLEWHAMPGPGPAVIEQPGESLSAPSRQETQQETQQRTAAGVRTPSKQACWTIRVVGKAPTTPACAPNYAATADGQCCLRSQMTAGGVCCPLGQAPDTNRRNCVAITPPPITCVRGFTLLKSGQCCLSSQVTATGQCCAPGQTPDANRRTCVTVKQPGPDCGRGYTLLNNQCCLNSQLAGDQCCPRGQRPDAKRQACVPVSGVTPVTPVTPCGPGSVLLTSGCCPRGQVNASGQCCPPGQRPEGRSCVTIAPVQPLCPGGVRPDASGKCPTLQLPPRCLPQQHWDGRRCVSTIIDRCPTGQHRVGKRCVPDQVSPCAPGQHRVGRRCVPDRVIISCPPGQHRVGQRCVSSQRVTPPSRQRVTPPLR